MPFFAVIGLDDPAHSAERRLAGQHEHRAYVPTNDADIAMVGALLGDDGAPCASFYLFEAESEQAVRDWLAREPYVQGGVYERLEVRPFLLGKNRLPVQDWPMARPAAVTGE